MRILKLFSQSLQVLLFLFSIISFAQTGIKITYYNGTSQDYTIEASGKLYFSGSNLLVKTNTAASNVSIPTSIIRKITFANATLATQEIGINQSQFALYPNPSSDFIRITSGKKEKLNVKIYSVTGKLVLQGTYQPDENIDISNLSLGFYFVQVNQTTLKLIKK